MASIFNDNLGVTSCNTSYDFNDSMDHKPLKLPEKINLSVKSNKSQINVV